MPKSLKVAVVLNGKSGTALDEAGVGRMEASFAEAGCEASVRRAGSGAELRALVEEAARSRPDAIAIGGGDGTLGTAAGVLVDRGIPMAVLPLGTLNHFARDLGIPTDLEEAGRTVATGPPAPIAARAAHPPL